MKHWNDGRKRLSFGWMNNLRNQLPVQRMFKFQIMLVLGAQIVSPPFCSFTEFYMEKGQPGQSDQLFHILKSQDPSYHCLSQEMCLSMTVNCVTLPTQSTLYLYGLKIILVQTDWTVVSLKFLVTLQRAKL